MHNPQQTLGTQSASVPGGMQFSNQGTPSISPTSQQSPLTQQQSHGQTSPQSGMFPFSSAPSNPPMDPRSASTGMMNQSGTGGINFASLTPQQRQLYAMQQQQQQQQMMRAGGSGTNMSGMMNVQQQAYAAAQERMRQEHQQRVLQPQGQTGSPHSGSPTAGNDSSMIPTLRSNASIPGISRSMRSPSDNASSPLGSRGPRVPSMHQDDYQRMMQAQQQAQAPQFNHQQMQAASNWQQQNQVQHQQSMQMGHGQSASFGMPPSGNTSLASSYGTATSPNNNANWPQTGSGHYPFASSPGASGLQHQPERVSTPRHVSASSTPAPLQQQQMQPQNASPQPDQTDFDLFSWVQ